MREGKIIVIYYRNVKLIGLPKSISPFLFMLGS